MVVPKRNYNFCYKKSTLGNVNSLYMVHRDFVIDNLFYLEVTVFLWSWMEVQKSYKRGKKSFRYYFYQDLTGKSCLLYFHYKVIVLQRILLKLRALRKEE